MEFKSFESNDKEVKWRAIEQEVESLGDKKGMKIDEGIRSAVIALRASGFATTGSCEGHTDWADPWPWVDVESPLAEKLLSDPHYNELKIKERAMRKGVGKMAPAEKKEYFALIHAQARENEKEFHRLVNLLGEYNRTRSDKSANKAALTVEKGPMNDGRLLPANVTNSDYEDVQKIWPESEKENRLQFYHGEMEKFAQFLKRNYFGQPN